jgi:AcrR family transcriptional regulator
MPSPDPRSLRSREAILVAARHLLLHHGPSGVTHQRVAEQAGVGRATVYRHWARAELLLIDVMADADLPFFRDPVAPVRPWLHEQLRLLAADLVYPEVRAVALTLLQGALWDPHIAHQRDHFVAAVDDRLAAALELAVRTGEATGRLEAGEAAALLAGSVLYRTAMQSAPVSDEFLTRLVDSLATWRPPGNGPGPEPAGNEHSAGSVKG